MRVIAEVGLSHEGSLGQAMAYCDAVAKAGADIVKFQNHLNDPQNKFRTGTFFPQDATRTDYWKRTAFTREEWAKLINYAHNKGLEFCVSVFSHEAIDLLQDLPVDYYKLGSAQTSDLSLVERLAGMKRPLILSSGMSDWNEFDTALDLVVQSGKMPIALQCTSEYPCPPEHIGLNVIDELFQGKTHLAGLSDHSGTIWPSLIAASKGADYCEVHVCWHRDCFGADVPVSITIDELKQLVQGVRFIERMVSNPVDKDEQAKSMEPMRRLFRVY